MQEIHNSSYQKELAKANERQLKKFTKLHVKKHGQQAETCNSTDKSKWVINFSSYDINKDEKTPGKRNELLNNSHNNSSCRPSGQNRDTLGMNAKRRS